METPLGLDRARHLELEHHSPIPRRIALGVLAALCLLALLDVFGQQSGTRRVDAVAASLTVNSPDRLRGGLVFTSEITLVAHRKLQDAQVQLSPGWFSGMTFNGIVPQPQNMSSSADGTTLDFGPLEAGESMPFWISWQTNPTTVGPRDQEIVVSDGSNQLLDFKRSLVVFP